LAILLDVGQQIFDPSGPTLKIVAFIAVVLIAEADLAKIVDALRAPGGFPNGLHGGHEQSDQDRDPRNNDEKFDECKAGSLGAIHEDLPFANGGGFLSID